MDLLLDWNKLQLVLSSIFVVVNSLFFIPWRKSFKTVLSFGCICISILIALSSYLYFFADYSFFVSFYYFHIFWIIFIFIFSRYRDARTLFSLIGIWTFYLSGSALGIMWHSLIQNLWLCLVLTLLTNLLFTITLASISKTYFTLMQLNKKGWLLGCVISLLPLLALWGFISYKKTWSEELPYLLFVVTISMISLCSYLIVRKLILHYLEQKKQEQHLNVMLTQVQGTAAQLQEAAGREKQSAILRHDLRHYASMIASCIQDQLYDKALESLQKLLEHPAMTMQKKQYCKNPSINALLRSYAQNAEENGITFHTAIALEESVCIDIMDLAVLLSNTLENAFHACMKQPEGSNREVHIKLRMAGEQLFIHISNSCDTPVTFDEQTGLPVSTSNSIGHGIGLHSILSFIHKYEAEYQYTQNDDVVQLLIVASKAKEEKKPVQKKHRTENSILCVNLVISALIAAGFLLAGISSYYTFNDLFRTDIELVSSLTSENIYANLTNIMDRPLNITTTMANDTLLRNLVQKESFDSKNTEMAEIMCDYLTAYQEKYNFDSVAFTSNKTKFYYHYKERIARTISPDNPEDKWFFEYMKEPLECKLNVDQDKINNYDITIFVDCKLKDADGTVLGVIGVGVKAPHIQQILQQAEKEYNLQAYLIDAKGNVQLSSNLTKMEEMNLFENPRFTDMAQTIVNNKISSEEKWYTDGNLDGYIITKYIPNLNWYLVVVKDTSELQNTMFWQLFEGFSFMILVVIVVLLITTSILTKYNGALIGRAKKDPLTGLRNRASYEQEMKIYGGRLHDYVDFGIGVFELNNLKRMNNMLGYQAGDAYLKDFSTLLEEIFLHCPIFRIGGNEFLVIFLNIPESEVIQKRELLRLTLRQRSLESLVVNYASFGYAFWEPEKLTTVEKLFKEAEHQMHLEKAIYKEQEKKL